MRGLMNRAAADPQRLVLTGADDPRVLRAARIIADEEIAVPILVGDAAEIARAAAEAEIDTDGLAIIDPAHDARRHRYAEALWSRRQRRGVTQAEACRRLLQPEYYGSMMV